MLFICLKKKLIEHVFVCLNKHNERTQRHGSFTRENASRVSFEIQKIYFDSVNMANTPPDIFTSVISRHLKESLSL